MDHPRALLRPARAAGTELLAGQEAQEQEVVVVEEVVVEEQRAAEVRRERAALLPGRKARTALLQEVVEEAALRADR